MLVQSISYMSEVVFLHRGQSDAIPLRRGKTESSLPNSQGVLVLISALSVLWPALEPALVGDIEIAAGGCRPSTERDFA